MEYDTSTNTGLWNAFRRIQVQLDVRQPLKQWKQIRGNDGKSSLIHFKYERLITFCYLCSMLGHWERFCEKIFSANEGEATQGWSPDLRAQMRKTTGYGGERWLRDTTASDTESTLFRDKDGRGYGQPRVHKETLFVTTRSNHVDIVRFGPKGPSRL